MDQMFHVKHLGKIFYGMNLRCKLTEAHLRFFLLYGELLYNALIKPKTLREDAARYMWNMSAKAECIWCTKRNKCY